jgi:hypothetical protein
LALRAACLLRASLAHSLAHYRTTTPLLHRSNNQSTTHHTIISILHDGKPLKLHLILSRTPRQTLARAMKHGERQEALCEL